MRHGCGSVRGRIAAGCTSIAAGTGFAAGVRCRRAARCRSRGAGPRASSGQGRDPWDGHDRDGARARERVSVDHLDIRTAQGVSVRVRVDSERGDSNGGTTGPVGAHRRRASDRSPIVDARKAVPDAHRSLNPGSRQEAWLHTREAPELRHSQSSGVPFSADQIITAVAGELWRRQVDCTDGDRS
jgi:hypothetical protein